MNQPIYQVDAFTSQPFQGNPASEIALPAAATMIQMPSQDVQLAQETKKPRPRRSVKVKAETDPSFTPQADSAPSEQTALPPTDSDHTLISPNPLEGVPGVQD